MFRRKPKRYLCIYERHDGVKRTCSVMAYDKDEAKDIADMRLEKQYGPQPYRFYLALRNEGGQVILDANGDPIISNEYETRYLYPENRNGEQDETLLQSNYRYVGFEKEKRRRWLLR